MKCIDPLVTGYERGTLVERSAQTELSPRQSRKNSEDDSRANNNIRETLGILSLPTMAPNGIKMYLGLKWPLASRDTCYDGWTDRVPQKAPTSTIRYNYDTY